MSNEFIVRYLGDSRTQTVGELIRCKDCYAYRKLTDTTGHCSEFTTRVGADHYCGYAERKEQTE